MEHLNKTQLCGVCAINLESFQLFHPSYFAGIYITVPLVFQWAYIDMQLRDLADAQTGLTQLRMYML